MEAMNGVMPTFELNKSHGGEGWGSGFGGMWFAWILILFVLMGGWGNGFGRNGQAGFDVASQFDYQDIKNGIRGVQEGINAGFYAQARDLCQGFAAVNAGINENRFAAQQCLTNLFKAIKKIFTFNLKAVGTCA